MIKYKKYLIIISCLLFLILTSLMHLKASSYKEFNKVTDNITKLEKLAAKYERKYPNSNWSKNFEVLIYIRNKRYHTNNWNFLAGGKDTNFENYITKQDKKNEIKSLKEIETLRVPGNYCIDFVHMIATINASNNVCGWAGDLSELISETSNNGVNFNEIYKKSRDTLGKKSSRFNVEDLYSDIDGLNITTMQERDDASLNICMKRYYYNNKNMRLKMFIKNLCGNIKITKNNLRKKIYDIYTKDFLVEKLLESYGINMDSQDSLIKANCYVFSDFLYNQYLKY